MRWSAIYLLIGINLAHAARQITRESVREALSSADREVQRRLEKEQKNPGRVNPAILAHGAFAPPTSRSLGVQRRSKTLIQASKSLGFRSPRGEMGLAATMAPGLSIADVEEEVRGFGRGLGGYPGGDPQFKCSQDTVTCDPSSKFREIDGRCNNIFHPEFGASSMPYLRQADPAYDDEFDAPRKLSVDKESALPSPRKVSLTVHETKPHSSTSISHMLMQWGQFVDHDITLTPQARAVSGAVMDCSSCDSATEVSEECFPIQIPSGDPLFPNGTCMHFIRSQPGQVSLGTREQINQITSYIDASNVYGSDAATAAELRLKELGRLDIRDNGLLPSKHEPACAGSGNNFCFKAGDVRSNVQAGLMSMHTLWVKHHNSIAEDLHTINPAWDDERLYQEARRIVIAQHQHITYSEFLPKVLGPRFVEEYGLVPNTRSHYNGYDRRCDATIYNEFAAAAYRFGHSLVDDTFQAAHSKNFELKGHFMDPTMLHKDPNFDSKILEGLTKQRAQEMDRFVSTSLRNHLFGSGDHPDGLDLIAMNIQRGRDHGLAPYYKYREIFGLATPRTFAQLVPIMGKDTTDALKNTYKSVDDIDLYTGILSEPHVDGALLGELGAHLIAAQFHRLKDCDRFYYENGRQTGSFTRSQLKKIRQSTSLAKILCQHTTSETELSADAFSANKSGPKLRCRPQDKERRMDLSAWKEKRGVRRRGKRSRIVVDAAFPICEPIPLFPEYEK